MSPADNQTVCRSFFDGVGMAIRRFLEPLLDLWQVLKLCRFAILTIVLVAVLLIWSSQGQEILIRLQTLQDRWGTQNMLFLLSVVTWAWAVWYWSRVIVSFRFLNWPPSEPPERVDRILLYNRVVPRALGVIAILVVAMGFFRSLEGRVATGPVVHNGGFYLLCAAIFALIVRKRRDWAARLRETSSLVGRLLPAPVAAADNPQLGFLYEDKYALPGPTRKALGWSFLMLFVIPLLVFQTRCLNLWIAPTVGSAFIILLAAASWIPPGTTLVYWGLWHRVPILTILFAYVALISAYNDNHAIRTIPQDNVAQVIKPSIVEHFRSWIDNRIEESVARSNPDPIPVIFIAAEGGGVRAAYWTASVLTRIQKDLPDFGSHVFVISAVSGGSLGAAVFAALMADEGSPGECTAPAAFPGCAEELLKQDYLSATFGTLLYPDLLQRFLFLPIRYWDRGQTLEMSWEWQWDNVRKHESNRFAEPFEHLWVGPNGTRVPGLILNMTSVERGNRVLMSNLRVSEPAEAVKCVEAWTGKGSGIFDDAIDFSEALNTWECGDGLGPSPPPSTIRLSTAVNNSARFSFISPAGTLNERLRIVDGGYFENSGMTSLEEVYRAVRPTIAEWNASRLDGRMIMPIVIYIGNEPEYVTVGVRYLGPLDPKVPPTLPECIRVEIHGAVPSHANCLRAGPALPNETLLIATKSVRDKLKEGRHYTLRLDRADTAVDIIESGLTYLYEVFVPLNTMYRSQQARGRHASLHLQRQVTQDALTLRAKFIRFGLRASSQNLPLGWTLSDESTQEMNDQLNAQFLNCRPTATQTLVQYVDTCWPDPR